MLSVWRLRHREARYDTFPVFRRCRVTAVLCTLMQFIQFRMNASLRVAWRWANYRKYELPVGAVTVTIH